MASGGARPQGCRLRLDSLPLSAAPDHRPACAAPDWTDAIRHRRNEHGADAPPGPPSEAWLWKQLHDELERRGRVSLQALQERLDQLGTELHRVTAEFIDRRAWAAQVNR